MQPANPQNSQPIDTPAVYSKPALVRYGTVAELTKAGGVPSAEGGSHLPTKHN